ncbi:MAG: discoidin domain-containing protein, partial [Oligoflexales bacterium]|nr:discoidin domain-containing protein [Oligoflexales bacterium]
STGHLATDGQESTIWESKPFESEWIYVDLGAEYLIDTVRVKWADEFSGSFEIQVSEEKKEQIVFKTVALKKEGRGKVDEISFARTSARYVKILGLSRGTSDRGYIIREFEVYGPYEKPKGETGKTSPERKTENGIYYLDRGWKIQNASFLSASPEGISSPDFNDSGWITATVPGTVLTSYLNVSAIPDPDYGDQQLLISDIFAKSKFWYRKEITLEGASDNGRTWLNFDGVNWKADVFFNGRHLPNPDDKKRHSIEGAFKRSRFDVTDIISVSGRNVLAVLIYPPRHPAEVTVQTLADVGENGGELSRDTPTFLASSGWDWMPTIRDRNIGIWDDVYLTQTGDVTIEDPFVKSRLELSSASPAADIVIDFELKNHSDRPVDGLLVYEILDENTKIVFEKEVFLDSFETGHVTASPETHPSLRLMNPSLWWPNGYGDQHLYRLSLKFVSGNKKVSDQKSIDFGIRELRAVVPSDKNKTLEVFVNGQMIQLLGGNWGMPDSMLRTSAEKYEISMRFHKELGFTMIRNWIGQTADREFYEAADRHGILIWDDFWNNNYGSPDPDDFELFLMNARDKIKIRRNHPSLALYCGENEGVPPDELNSALERLVSELDGTRIYFPNSKGFPVKGGGPWHVMDNKSYFNRADGLLSELGMPNVPPAESVRAMMPEKYLWPINDMWGIHDYGGGNGDPQKYTRTIYQSYGEAKDLDDFCLKAQLLNYDKHRAMFEGWANILGNGNSGGVLLWMSHP